MASPIWDTARDLETRCKTVMQFPTCSCNWRIVVVAVTLDAVAEAEAVAVAAAIICCSSCSSCISCSSCNKGRRSIRRSSSSSRRRRRNSHSTCSDTSSTTTIIFFVSLLAAIASPFSFFPTSCQSPCECHSFDLSSFCCHSVIRLTGALLRRASQTQTLQQA